MGYKRFKRVFSLFITVLAGLASFKAYSSSTNDTTYADVLVLFSNEQNQALTDFKFQMIPLEMSELVADTVYHFRSKSEGLDLRTPIQVIAGIDTPETASVRQLFHSNQIAVYPNPGNKIHIQAPSNFTNLRLEIYNEVGQLIKSVFVAAERTIDLSTVNKGLYTFMLFSNEELVYAKRHLVRSTLGTPTSQQNTSVKRQPLKRKTEDDECTYLIKWYHQKGYKAGSQLVNLKAGSNPQLFIQVPEIDSVFRTLYFITYRDSNLRNRGCSDKLIIELDSNQNVIDTLFRSEVSHAIGTDIYFGIDSVMDAKPFPTKTLVLVALEGQRCVDMKSTNPDYAGNYEYRDTILLSDTSIYYSYRAILSMKPVPKWVGTQKVKGKLIDTDSNAILNTWVYLYNEMDELIDSGFTFNNRQGHYEIATILESGTKYMLATGSRDSNWTFLSYYGDDFTARDATLGNADTVFFANYTFIPKVGRAPLNNQLDTLSAKDVIDLDGQWNLPDAIYRDANGLSETLYWLDNNFTPAEKDSMRSWAQQLGQKLNRTYVEVPNEFNFQGVSKLDPYDKANRNRYGINIRKGGSSTNTAQVSFTDATSTYGVIVGGSCYVTGQIVFNKEVGGRMARAKGVPSSIRVSYMNPVPDKINQKDSRARDEIQKVQKAKLQNKNTIDNFFANTNHTFGLGTTVNYIPN